MSIFQNLIAHLFSNDAKMTDSTPLKYVAAGNGQFEVRSNAIMQVTKKIEGTPKMPNLQEGIALNIPKIPFDLFNLMTSFMKKIYETDVTESTFMIFYNKEQNKFIPWIPQQTNGSASSKYNRDEDPEYTAMCRENILVMVAHSHPWGSGGVQTTSPSPSGIDDADEKEAILYMVVGNVKGVPTTYVSTCPGGKRMKLKFFDVFENPLDVENQESTLMSLVRKYVPEHEVFSLFCKTDLVVPEEYFKKCKKTAIYSYGSTYGTSYSSKGPGSWSDPATQYRTRMGILDSFGDEEDDVEDWQKYAEYYYTSRHSYSNESDFEEFSEDDIGKQYHRRLASVTRAMVDDVSEEDEGLIDALEEEVNAYTVGDIIDTCLEFDDVQVAQVIIALIKEGKGSLINQCLNVRFAGQKADNAPGLKLIKSSEHKGGDTTNGTKGT